MPLILVGDAEEAVDWLDSCRTMAQLLLRTMSLRPDSVGAGLGVSVCGRGVLKPEL